ncbi:MAG: CHAT domain-containing protein [Lewinellaceae bacterium]|nr:CHAT domain-containing protein [Lewinellaceae bacterium]
MPTHHSLLICLMAVLTANQVATGQPNPATVSPKETQLLKADSLFQTGRNYHLNKKNYREALVYYDSALHIREQYLPEEHRDIAQLYNNIGLAKAMLGYTREAIAFHQKALRIRQKIYPPGNDTIGHSLANLGQAYGIAHEPQKCIDYSMQALAILENSPAVMNKGSVYVNLAGAYLYEEEWEKALDYIHKAKAIMQVMAPAELISNEGAAYIGLKQYREALEHFQNANTRLAKLAPNNPIRPSILSNIGSAYQLLGQLVEAEQWHLDALALSRKLFGEQHPEVARDFQNLGTDRYLQDDVEGALRYLDSARAALPDPNGPFQLISSPDQYFTIEGSRTEALIKAYLLTGDTTRLRQAIRITLTVDRFIDNIRPNYTGRHAREYLQKLAKTRYERGLYACWLLWQRSKDNNLLETAYWFIEKSKALALYGAMQADQALKDNGLPETLVNREENLRADLASTEKQYWIAVAQKADLTEINAKAAGLRLEYDKLIQQIAIDFPEYNRARFELPVRNLLEIRQKHTPPGTTLLHYFAGDTSLFILAIQADKAYLREVPNTFSLNRQIDDLIDGITGYADSLYFDKNLKLYKTAARLLYDSLVAPVAPWLDSVLIIIPDGRLALIPFEALLTGEANRSGNYADYPYMLRKHRIYYAYSATLLDEMGHKSEHNGPLTFSGFAPWDRKMLGYEHLYLRHSGKEIQQIATCFQAPGVFLAEQASLDQFYSIAPVANVLHLSSHAWTDEHSNEHAFITFSPKADVAASNLYLGDIYNLRLVADLVVLSACQTNLGKFSRGEGILSLSRAFAYARAKSIVSSFWKVNDPATAALMVAFYQNLLPGCTESAPGPTKAEALRLAKFQLIAGDNGQWAHPYFWAGFILIGDNAPLR